MEQLENPILSLPCFALIVEISAYMKTQEIYGIRCCIDKNMTVRVPVSVRDG